MFSDDMAHRDFKDLEKRTSSDKVLISNGSNSKFYNNSFRR